MTSTCLRCDFAGGTFSFNLLFYFTRIYNAPFLDVVFQRVAKNVKGAKSARKRDVNTAETYHLTPFAFFLPQVNFRYRYVRINIPMLRTSLNLTIFLFWYFFNVSILALFLVSRSYIYQVISLCQFLFCLKVYIYKTRNRKYWQVKK